MTSWTVTRYQHYSTPHLSCTCLKHGLPDLMHLKTCCSRAFCEWLENHTCIDTFADSICSTLNFGIILPTREVSCNRCARYHEQCISMQYKRDIDRFKAPLSWNINHWWTSTYVCLPDVWAEFPRKLVGCREPPMYECLYNTTASTWTLESSMLLYT